MSTLNNLDSTVWGFADTLRGVYARNKAGDVILPFTILRRLECVMAPYREQIDQVIASTSIEMMRRAKISKLTGGAFSFYNTTPHTLDSLYAAGAQDLVDGLLEYVAGFSEDIDVFANFNFSNHASRLNKGGILAAIVRQFKDLPLDLESVPNERMGELFEHLIYMDFESSNAESGDHYTPRDAIRLLVDLLFAEDDLALSGPVTRTIYDPTVGTGGMLSVAQERLAEMNPQAELVLYGQELRPESYALCRSDLISKGQDPKNITLGNTLTEDKFDSEKFDYVLSNPPYGVDWKKDVEVITEDAAQPGSRFAPGLPSTSDGALLFVEHAISKMRPAAEGGSRVGIVLNGSPLFSGGAESGPSNIRGWLLDNNLLEAIVALPNDMFYNTGIATYLWIFDNTKQADRCGKVQLIDATSRKTRMRKGLGSKRVEISEADRVLIASQYRDREQSATSKVFDNLDFAYWQATIERPLRLNFACTPERVALVAEHKALGEVGGLVEALTAFGEKVYINREEFMGGLGLHLGSVGIRLTGPQRKALWQTLGERDETADVCRIPTGKNKGQDEPDPGLRDTEIIPVGWNGRPKTYDARDKTIQAYFEAEVTPHVAGAWIAWDKIRIGYEIPFTRHFYVYEPPEPLEEIDARLEASIAEIMTLLRKVEEDTK
ncbi:N-6 DNA methylase [Streptomyces anulatus]